jgi:hypothetical protein
MAVGQVSEKVEVTAESPLLQTDSSQRDQVVSGDMMRQLALNGREYSALALLTPGVRQSALNKITNGTPREGAFDVNGLRSVFNYFLIDGVTTTRTARATRGSRIRSCSPRPTRSTNSAYHQQPERRNTGGPARP